MASRTTLTQPSIGGVVMVLLSSNDQPPGVRTLLDQLDELSRNGDRVFSDIREGRTKPGSGRAGMRPVVQVTDHTLTLIHYYHSEVHRYLLTPANPACRLQELKSLVDERLAEWYPGDFPNGKE